MRKVALLAEQKALNDGANDEERDLTDEEQQTFDAREKEIDEVNRRIERELKLQERLADMKGLPLASLTGEPEKPEAPAVHTVNRGTLRHWKGNPDTAYRAGVWCQAAIFGRSWAQQECRSLGIETRVMVEDANVKGGFLVPDEFSQMVIQLREQYGTARRDCTVWPMGSDTLSVAKETGGLTTYYVGEETAITASDMSFDRIQLTARKLCTLTRVSMELAEDAVISIADILANRIAYDFAVEEDKACFIGDGTSTYGGISGLITQTALSTKTTAKYEAASGNTAFSTLDLADFEGMMGQLGYFPGMQPQWYIHKVGWAQSMLRLVDALGGNTVETIAGQPRMTFLGYPINFVQCMNSTTTAQTSTNGLCYLGDLRMAAAFGSRSGLTIKASDDRYIEYLETVVIGVERYDINVHLGNASTTERSPMVMLCTPSS